jgi:Saxitoxin biosynthesis operon protein SxtJ
MAKKGTSNPERAFGVSVGVALCVIALLLLWRGRAGRAEIVGATGAFLLVCGLVHPPLLEWPSAWWWRFSRVLGHVNARVLLTLLFAIMLVPLSLLWRLTGNDPLGRRRDRWPGWSPSPASHRDRGHYTRMY